jgi:hypothetical protein
VTFYLSDNYRFVLVKRRINKMSPHTYVAALECTSICQSSARLSQYARYTRMHVRTHTRARPHAHTHTVLCRQSIRRVRAHYCLIRIICPRVVSTLISSPQVVGPSPSYLSRHINRYSPTVIARLSHLEGDVSCVSIGTRSRLLNVPALFSYSCALE